jgi:hypothetical protein
MPDRFGRHASGRHASRATDAGTEKIRRSKPWPTALPKQAPELWPGKREAQETLPVFFRRVWGKYVRKGLRMSHLKDLDPGLAGSLRGHLDNGLSWPDDLRMATQRSELQEAVREFNKGNINKIEPKLLLGVVRKLQRKKHARLDH